MKLDWPIEIIGTGIGLPSQVVTNQDFASRLDTSDEWIVQRTGIRERRIARPGEATVDFCLDASREALTEAGLTPQEIDLLICATITPDHTLPASACEIQARLGCRTIPAFDLVAACSGFVWSLVTGGQYVMSGMAKHALLVGGETMSRITDMEDRATCVLFGDGAGAAIIRKSTDSRRRILAARMGADGGQSELIWIPAGGTHEPYSQKVLDERLNFIRMRGREVFKFAVNQAITLIDETLADADVKPSEISLMIPHQSNLRIIEAAMERMGISEDRVVVNIQRYGNTSAASVPIGLHEARRSGRLKDGDLVLFVAIGAGMTWGSVLMQL